MLSPTTSVEYEHPNVFTVLPNPHGPNAADEADAILANLQENRFVDLRTRAVFVDFTIYNPMLDFSCVIRMAGELPDSGPWHTFAPLAWRVQYAVCAHTVWRCAVLPAGGVMPLKRFITVRLYRDYKFGDYIRILAEALVLLMVIRYSVLELISMFRNGTHTDHRACQVPGPATHSRGSGASSCLVCSRGYTQACAVTWRSWATSRTSSTCACSSCPPATACGPSSSCRTTWIPTATPS